jgi:hypothetical protein
VIVGAVHLTARLEAAPPALASPRNM